MADAAKRVKAAPFRLRKSRALKSVLQCALPRKFRLFCPTPEKPALFSFTNARIIP